MAILSVQNKMTLLWQRPSDGYRTTKYKSRTVLPPKKQKTKKKKQKKPVHNCSKVLTEVSLEDAD